MDNLYNITIDELNLSKFTYNALKRGGISTLYDLKSLIEENSITNIPYIGEEGEKEIIEKFKAFVDEIEDKQLITPPQTKSRDSIVENLAAFDISNDISVKILENYLGEKTVNNLLNAKIYTLGDLNDLVSAYLQVMNSEESILDHANEELANAAKALILDKGLHISTLIDGRKLYNIIYQVPKSLEQKLSKYKLLKRILESKSLSEELDLIFQDTTNREREIFVRYTLEQTSYRELGDQYGISGERIRQIYNNSVDLICKQLEIKPNLFLQTVCLIADGLGDDLNPEKLQYKLNEIGMLDSKFKNQNRAILNRCLALIVNKKTSILIDPMFKS